MQDFNFIDFYIQRKRIQHVEKYIPQGCNLLDIGCGIYPYLLYKLKNKITRGIGIDKEIPGNSTSIENVEFIKSCITDTLQIKSESIDVVTMLAVLEHFAYPREILGECMRVLREGGTMIITVPSYYSRPILNMLAWFGISSKEEIYDHKNWFKKGELEKIVQVNGFKIMESLYYNFGLNILMVCKKN
ncbi:MAG TPA: class I SAM-dependent methyltransferase [Candidatus Wunengus sp. YC65]|uniref:class I SAM-dependent methyltransferase n=1 Tax=Candidatus Wunengus sp. YC65 TaxID=3367701 RepID=UPI004025836C